MIESRAQDDRSASAVLSSARSWLKRTPLRNLVLALRQLSKKDSRWLFLASASPLRQMAPVVAGLKCMLPTPTGPRAIHVIGDSHCAVFSGHDEMIAEWPIPHVDLLPGYRVYRLGPGLAYNLGRLRTTSRCREKLLAILAYGPVEPRGLVMLTFGEIDCRFHLLKQAEQQNRPVEELVRECVDAYVAAILELRDFGFRPLVWNVIPSGQPGEQPPSEEFPHWGTAQQRQHVTRLFNQTLDTVLEGTGVPFVSIFDRLLDAEGIPLHHLYYRPDTVHLCQNAIEFANAAVLSAVTAMDYGPTLLQQAAAHDNLEDTDDCALESA